MPKKPLKIELNAEFKQSLNLMEKTRQNAFITGRAGTGKSTLLQFFCDTTRKKAVVLAPTGVAAINVRGQTIHSFFGFKPDITISGVKTLRVREQQKKTYKNLNTIIIDEISMVRADLLDCIAEFLRLYGPKKGTQFGGVQMIFFGDLYQLPPVVTSRDRDAFNINYKSPYFFDAHSFQYLNPVFIELEKVYRQKDDNFITLLNAIRNNTAGDTEINALNARHDPCFTPESRERYIYLTTTNADAEVINRTQLEHLKHKLHCFEGSLSGKFEPNHLPTSRELAVKKGAQIMMVNNDSGGRWVNGTLAVIANIEFDDEQECEVIIIELADGRIEQVYPHTWELFNFHYNEKSREIESDIAGSFTQYPLMLAWAVTIHKSQGKTFDRVIVDIGRGTFAHGQLYVALSRCTSFEGMVLKKPIAKKHIWMDWRVVKFVTGFQYDESEKTMSLKDKIALIKQTILEKKDIEITYLKAQDEKSRRIITPQEVGKMEYMDKPYIGVEAYCHSRRDTRIFRVDRILDMRVV